MKTARATADTMAHKFEELERACIQQANVTPHWLSGGDVFWYKRETREGESEFILVNCEAGSRLPAFDHEDLAAKLKKHTNQDISARSLPFWWINVASDGAWSRFQFEDKTWHYDKNGALDVWNGDFDSGDFDKGCGEKPSIWSRQSSLNTIANHTTGQITYSWIDNDGSTHLYGAVATGQTKRQQTYAGHVWKVALKHSDKSVCFAAREHNSTVIVEELPQKLVLRWEVDSTTEMSDVSENEDREIPGPECFIRDFNVWVKDFKGSERQISFDGFVDNEFNNHCIYKSSDGTHIVAFQCRAKTKRLLHTIESSPKGQLAPKLSSTPYLKPGDNVEIQRPRLFNLADAREILIEDALFKNPYAISNIGWSPDNRKYRFLFNERGHKHLRLLEIDLGGNVRVLAEESSDTFVDYHQKIYYKLMESKQELLWTSERDGWNHLYLFDLTNGTLKNQVTKGDWVVRSVNFVDEKNRAIWFTAYGVIAGRDPYYAHLARVNFDGTDLQVVTEGNGTHTWKWSPDKRFLIDTWSRVDYPPQTVLIDAQTGVKKADLEQVNPDVLKAAGWSPPEIFESLGRDGETSIHGIIVRPNKFDTSKKYPVIEQIYAGPQNFYTPKAFQTLSEIRERANQGYILVVLDGMGTNWRSKSFHNVCYKNLKDGGFPDRIAWIRAAAKTRPWMDLARVGCYGSSAGGQNAAAALLHHGDFYKVAIASSGCHDNRMDKLWWNELWMGYPVDSSYQECSNVTHAHKLKGALMLCVGELDTNVDPSTTLQVAKALIDADKDFDLVFVPGGDHHVLKLPWMLRKQDQFFRQHLQRADKS